VTGNQADGMHQRNHFHVNNRHVSKSRQDLVDGGVPTCFQKKKGGKNKYPYTRYGCEKFAVALRDGAEECCK
jgi:hypothetical protein